MLEKQNTEGGVATLLKNLNSLIEANQRDEYPLALEASKQMLKEQTLRTSPNRPRLDLMSSAAKRLSAEWLVGQNLAPGSASCPSHLHLQILPRKLFPLIKTKMEEEKTIDAELHLSIQNKEIPAYWLVGPTTVLRLELEDLSPSELKLLTDEINTLILETQATRQYGIDVATHQKEDGKIGVYLSFRNQESGGIYRSLGMVWPDQIPPAPSATFEAAFTQSTEPSQINTASFVTRLRQRLKAR